MIHDNDMGLVGQGYNYVSRPRNRRFAGSGGKWWDVARSIRLSGMMYVSGREEDLSLDRNHMCWVDDTVWWSMTITRCFLIWKDIFVLIGVHIYGYVCKVLWSLLCVSIHTYVVVPLGWSFRSSCNSFVFISLVWLMIYVVVY